MYSLFMVGIVYYFVSTPVKLSIGSAPLFHVFMWMVAQLLLYFHFLCFGAY